MPHSNAALGVIAGQRGRFACVYPREEAGKGRLWPGARGHHSMHTFVSMQYNARFRLSLLLYFSLSLTRMDCYFSCRSGLAEG